MKKLTLLFLLITINSFAKELDNFSDIKSAVLIGKSIHIVTDFAKCSPPKEGIPQPTHVGVFTPNEMQILQTYIGTSIVTSLMHFTLNNPKFPNTAVYEFVKYTIMDVNSLNLSYQILDAHTYSPLAEKISFECKLQEGVKIYD